MARGFQPWLIDTNSVYFFSKLKSLFFAGGQSAVLRELYGLHTINVHDILMPLIRATVMLIVDWSQIPWILTIQIN